MALLTGHRRGRWLESTFGLKPGELHRVRSFFLFFVGIGMFYTVGVTVGDTLFLSHIPPARIPKTLPWIYVGIAVLGFAAVMVYDAIQARWSRHVTIIGAQLVLAATVLVFRWLVDLDREAIYFLLMVWLEVAALVAITIFFSFAGDYFSPRDARRLYPFIVGGMALGTVIAGYATSVVVIFIGTRNLLFVCAGLMLANAVIALVIHRRSTPLPPELEPEERGVAIASLKSVFKRSYVRLIALMIAMTLVMSVVVDFQMKWVASDMPEETLARFFGAFYGWVGVAQIGVQFFVVPQVLRRLGIINSLMIFPGVIALLACGLVAASGVDYFGVGLLMFAAAVNFARITLAETLDLPSKELLFLPLPTRVRVRAQPFMNGALAAAARGIAGGLLLVLVYWDVSAERLSILAVLCAIAIAMLLVRLRPLYRETLAETLRDTGGRGVDLSHLAQQSAGRPVFEELLQSDDAEVVTFTLRLLRERPVGGLEASFERLLSSTNTDVLVEVLACVDAEGETLRPQIREHLAHPRAEVREAAVLALGRVSGKAAGHEISKFLTDADEGMQDAAALALSKYGGDAERALVVPLIEGLASREDPGSRARAARLIGAIGGPVHRGLLKQLLRDAAHSVRILAVEAIGATADGSAILLLLDALRDPDVRPHALHALGSLSPDSVPRLSDALREEAMPPADRRALLHVVAAIGGPEAARALTDPIERFATDLVTAVAAADALRGLRAREGGYRIPLRGHRRRLKVLLDFIALLNRIGDAVGAQSPFAAGIFADHARAGIRLLLSVVGLRRDPHQMERVLFNLFSDSSVVTARALELLDVVLPRSLALEVASLLRPLLEDIPARGAPLDERDRHALQLCEPWLRAAAYHARPELIDGITTEEAAIADRLSKVSLLKTVPLFERIPAYQLIEMVEYIETLALGPGARLFEQGAPGDACFLLTEGEARVRVDGEVVAHIEPGECIGEMALLLSAPRSATIEMATQARLIRMSGARFTNVLKTEPSAAKVLLRTLDHRIRHTQTKRKPDISESAVPVPVHLGAVRSMTLPDLARLVPTLSFLGRVDLFASLSLENLTKIAEIVREVFSSSGEVLFRQGDVGDALYLVRSGRVEVLVDDEPAAVLGKNSYIGEMALIGQKRRSATVRVVDDASFYRIWSDDFSRMLTTEPEVSLALLRTLAARLKKVSARC